MVVDKMKEKFISKITQDNKKAPEGAFLLSKSKVMV